MDSLGSSVTAVVRRPIIIITITIIIYKYIVSQKNQTTILVSIFSPKHGKFGRFSKPFHCHTQQEICNEVIIKDPTAP